MVCSWALVLIHQDLACPSKATCEQDARGKSLASSSASQGCIWEFSTSLSWLPALPHTHLGAGQLSDPQEALTFCWSRGG